MEYNYKTTGVCARSIKVNIEDGIVTAVSFEGGCNGNTKGVSQLSVGMSAKDLIGKLKGIRCGMKPTSCPDQLAVALEEALMLVDAENQADASEEAKEIEQPEKTTSKAKI